MKKHLAIILSILSVLVLSGLQPAVAREAEIVKFELPGGDTVDIRKFTADGDTMMLGFACDEGTGQAEMHTASLLADTELEIWMPDLLSAHFLPKLRSSIGEIPVADIVSLIDEALASSDKALYLISSGPGSAMLLEGLVQWEQANPTPTEAPKGVILLYPRLNAGEPEPGKDIVYIDAVGKTRTPIAILEGAKTPNSWALDDLKARLEAGGSLVTTAVIPGVRGYFYERQEQNLPEDIVTDQLAGLIRASLIKLELLVE